MFLSKMHGVATVDTKIVHGTVVVYGCLDGLFMRFLGFGSLHQKLQALTRASGLQLRYELPRRSFV